MLITGKILALDMAASTGIAIGVPGDKPALSTYNFPSTGENVGRHQRNVRNWVRVLLDREQPEFVIFEQPSLFGKTTPITVRKLCSLVNTLEEGCDQLGIRCRQGNPSEIKKFWTGKGNAKKPDMVAWAHRFGLIVRNDDEADAAAHFFFAVHCYGTDEAKKTFQQMQYEVSMGRNQRVAF